MRDVTGINFRIMNEELRVELLLSSLGEAFEMEYPDEQKIAIAQAIVRVPNGEELDDSGDAETPDDELTDTQFVSRLIDFHYGNMV